MDESRLVYNSAAPPDVELWLEEVTHNGRTWQQHKLTVQSGQPGVIVVATFQQKLLLVDHWRPAIGRQLLEFPRGFGELQEGNTSATQAPTNVISNALRELSEEAGIGAHSPRFLGFIWPDSGILTGRIGIVQLVAESTVPSRTRDGEVGDLHWYTESEIEERIAKGEIADALTISAYYLWRVCPSERPRKLQ